MIRLALKMLFGDTAKYLMLIFGLMFATFLMAQQVAVFFGLMNFTTSILVNVPAPIWVVETSVEQVNESNPLRDTDLSLVRSVNSVEWAMPLFSGLQKVRLLDGSLKTVSLIGIDSTTFAGAPIKIKQGRLEDLRLPHTVIVDELAITRLGMGKERPLKMGDVFEINDQEARVVGICEARQSFTGGPYVWTTYERALQYVPPTRKMLAGIIAAPRAGISNEAAVEEIQRTTGLRAFVNEGFQTNELMKKFGDSTGSYKVKDFSTSTIWWYFVNTGIPISFGTTVIVGLVVGIAISSQTFYAFVLENMKHLGALKAMGTSTWTLCVMLIAQALAVGIVGFGIGLFFVGRFAAVAMKKGVPPFYMPWQVPVGVFGVIVLICLFAAFLGIVRVARLEPAMVFRA